ncbi:2-dehydropantoate 2-reductase, partial [bacterium]|nr:2-dehydropantoate 2-reductase [bacterium]
GASPVARLPVVDGAIAAGGVADLIILAVKTYDLIDAARSAAPLVGPETHFMTIQNGIEAADRIAGLYGSDRVIACVSYALTRMVAPGVVESGGVSGGFEIGGLEDVDAGVVQRVVDVFARAGLEVSRRDDVRTALWEKFLVICVTGGVMALARGPLGPVLATEEGRNLVRGILGEAAAVAEEMGVRFPPDAAERAYEFVSTRVAPEARSSQLEDLLAGRRLELESLNGTVVRLGRELGVPTPMNLAVYAALKPYMHGSN